MEPTVAASPRVVLNFVLESDTKTKLSETLPSLDYVPALPDYFPRSDQESDPKEASEEDPLGDDSSKDDTSDTSGPLSV
nr:hypothetical protein [Tanacetum cinerariifolium]